MIDVPDFLVERARRFQPNKDELAIRKEVITFVPTVISVIIGVFMSLFFYAAGVPSIGTALLAIALVQASTYAVATFRPRLTEIMLVCFGFVAVGANFYIHAESGGFTSGVWALAWLPLVTLAVYFVAGERTGLFVLLLAFIAVSAAVLLDSRFAASPLAIPYRLRLFYDFVTLTSVLLVGYDWASHLYFQLEIARQQADALLLNILPRSIAVRLKAGEEPIADSYDAVTVLFADIVDFTPMSADANPVAVVGMLNEIFSDFDDLAARYGLEKIKTVGDAYMVAGGLPEPRPDHAEAVAAFAVDMLEAIGRHQSWTGDPIRLRVGINTGPIVAGVIGRQKFIYDVWGDAVNVASRMESNGLANQIQVTAAVKERLDGHYEFEERPRFEVKGKGFMVTYLMRPLAS